MGENLGIPDHEEAMKVLPAKEEASPEKDSRNENNKKRGQLTFTNSHLKTQALKRTVRGSAWSHASQGETPQGHLPELQQAENPTLVGRGPEACI